MVCSVIPHAPSVQIISTNVFESKLYGTYVGALLNIIISNEETGKDSHCLSYFLIK